MPKILQFKRYANTVVAGLTGANGEIIIDSTNKTITVHDGVTVGGKRLATESYVANNSGIGTSPQAAFNQANAATTLAQAAYNNSNTKISKSGDTMTGDLKFSRGGAILGNVGQNEITMTSNVIDDWSGFTAYGYGAAQIYANTFVQLIANTGLGGATIWNFNPDGSLTFPDNTIQNTAFTGTAIDQAFRNTANTATNNITTLQNVNLTQNTNITTANNAAWAAFAQANVIAGGLTTANANISLMLGVQTTQNTWINSNASAILVIQGVNNTQNTNITAAAQTIPQNAQSTNYVLQLSDAGKHIYYTQASNTILYVPTTANVAFSNGVTITIISRTSSSANVTVSPNTGVSMYLAGNTTSASRNVTTYGMATLIQVAANTWFINGTGVA